MGYFKVGEIFTRSWELFFQNALPLIVGSILLVFLGALSLGIALPSLTAGMYIILQKSVEEGRTKITDIFLGLQGFWQYFFAGMISLLAFCIGLLFFGIGIFVTLSMILFLFPLMVDRKLDAVEAMSYSYDLFKNNWAGFLVLFLLSSVVENIGNLVFFGVFLSMPFAKCMVYIAYLQTKEAVSFREQEPLSQ